MADKDRPREGFLFTEDEKSPNMKEPSWAVDPEAAKKAARKEARVRDGQAAREKMAGREEIVVRPKMTTGLAGTLSNAGKVVLTFFLLCVVISIGMNIIDYHTSNYPPVRSGYSYYDDDDYDYDDYESEWDRQYDIYREEYDEWYESGEMTPPIPTVGMHQFFAQSDTQVGYYDNSQTEYDEGYDNILSTTYYWYADKTYTNLALMVTCEDYRVTKVEKFGEDLYWKEDGSPKWIDPYTKRKIDWQTVDGKTPDAGGTTTEGAANATKAAGGSGDSTKKATEKAPTTAPTTQQKQTSADLVTEATGGTEAAVKKFDNAKDYAEAYIDSYISSLWYVYPDADEATIIDMAYDDAYEDWHRYHK